MTDVVLDANVLVGWLDSRDTLAERSAALLARLRGEGSRPVLVDVCVGEAIQRGCLSGPERHFW